MKTINLNFATNESVPGAIEALQLLLQGANKNSVNILNEKLAKLFKTESTNVFTFLSARAALKILLESLNLPKESEVLVLGFTCEAVVLPILASGLLPIYVDIEKDTYSFNYKDLLLKTTTSSRVIILQHSFGMTPRDRDRIILFAKNRDILVIEDLAHGFHPDIFEKNSLTIKLLSFGRSKLLSSVHGGAIVTPTSYSNESIVNLYSQLSYPTRWFVFRSLLYKIISPVLLLLGDSIIAKVLHKILFKLKVFTQEISPIEKKGKYDAWLQYKLPNEFAKILIAQVDNYKQTISARIEISKMYDKYFKQKYKFSTPILRYPLVAQNVEAFSAYFRLNGVIVGNWYRQPIAPLDLNLKSVGYIMNSCPVAEELCQRITNLPTNITKNQAKWITKLYEEYQE